MPDVCHKALIRPCEGVLNRPSSLRDVTPVLPLSLQWEVEWAGAQKGGGKLQLNVRAKYGVLHSVPREACEV